MEGDNVVACLHLKGEDRRDARFSFKNLLSTTKKAFLPSLFYK